MTLQQLGDRAQHLENRVAALEAELMQMKQLFAELQRDDPWWTKIAGSFENDSTFDEAIRFGQEWRKSAE